MIKIKKYQIEDYISDATQDALDLKADLVDGKVPASQLPSFVDDVIEVANYAALPIPGATGVIYITLDTNKVYRWTGSVYVEISSGVTNLSYTPGVSNGVVNSDTGSDATIPLAGTVNAGLFSAAEKSKLEGIAPNANVGVIPNAPITGATKTKITYDSKGLVTSGDDATTADISSSTNKRYVTDANLTVINNTSGTNTGDQNLQQVTDNGATTTNSITADSFIKSGGLATEYLMADGTTTTGGGGDFVPYTGATSDVNLGEFGIQLGNLEFDNTPTNIPTTAGSMYYNDADGTLDLILKGGNVTLQVGQETVIRVVNKTATNISLLESNYQAVRITGAQGQRPKVDLAQATNDVLSAETIGLVTETIANNQEGFITTSGLVRGINTTGSLQGETWLDGDILYLSSTVAGSVTKVKPIAPNHLIIIGYVISAHITQGTIFVKVDNGYELDELHNVYITSPLNNQSLIYETSTQLWKNKSMGLQQITDINAITTNALVTNVSGGVTAIIGGAENGTGVYAASTNGDGFRGYSENGLGGRFETDGIGNIVEFVSANTTRVAVQNDGKITATAGTASTDVVVKSQLDLKANDASVVHIAGTEIITGAKTFSSQTILGDGVVGATQYGLTPQATVGSTSGGVFDIRNTNTNIVAGNTVGTLQFSAKDDDSVAYLTAQIKAITQNGIGTGSSGKTDLIFYTSNGSSSIERVKMNDLGLVINSEVTSTIASFDSNKSIKSLTTADGYPSLVELKYVKGVTSSIQTQLDGKVDENTAITGATKTKITYDSKGLVTAGADIATTDISDFNSATRAQVEAELVAGTNITITPSGTGATRQLTIAATGGASSQSAFTMLANNTSSSAVPTEQPFESIGNQTYTGIIVQTASSAASGATNHSYAFTQVGKLVSLRINIDFANAGASVSSIACELPSDCPAPALPTGVSASGDVIVYGIGTLAAQRSLVGGMGISALRIKSGTVYEVVVTRTASTFNKAYYSIQYFTV